MRTGSAIHQLPSSLATSTSSVFRRLRSRPGVHAFIAFLFVYVALIRYCSYAYYRDPTSAFFDPVRGYERHYSLKRQQDAEAFIRNANDSIPSQTKSKNIKMCVGMATIARDGEQYVRSAIGSLLDGLTPEEREELFMAVLVAETKPELHPIYSEQWLVNIVDKVLLYDVPQSLHEDLVEWETKRDYRKKAIFDYTYILQRCYDTGAQWITIIEDDTLAVDEWYPRAIEALAAADEQRPAGRGDWLYLRLFYTEEFLGWNSEDWSRYLIGSVGVTGMTVAVLLLMRQLVLTTAITNTVVAVVSLICCPMCIALYFAAGKMSMQPYRPGVHEMPKFGCCGQGFTFSHQMASKLIARLALVRVGFVDEIIEAWANELDLVRWVVSPSLLQHIGGHSSKGDDYGGKAKYARSVAEKIWNFGFEMYDDNVP